MARIHRFDPEHGIHHVYSRGTRRWTLFIDDIDYQRFMLRLGAVCARYGISVYAYCLMGNHFHLVLYCPDGQLSQAMRDLKSVYARQHNDRHGFSGPLFEARFGSKLVRSERYLQVLIRYVHRNPVALRSAFPLANYPWSSHAYYLDMTLPRPNWLVIDYPRSMFGEPTEYRHFVEGNVGQQVSRHVHSALVRPTCSRTSLSAIMMTVAASAECGLTEIRPRMRNGLAGLVVLIASDRAHYTSAELSDACGFGSPQGARNAKQAARKRLGVDLRLREVHDEVVAKLW